MKVALTGATGFIGSHVLAELQEHGHEVTALVRDSAQADGLARDSGDKWRLSQILWWQAYTAIHDGDPRAAIAAGEEGRDLADEVGDRFVSRLCRFWHGTAHLIRGDLAEAEAQFRALLTEAEADHDVMTQFACHCHLGHTLAWLGDTAGARDAATAAVEARAEFGGVLLQVVPTRARDACRPPVPARLKAGSLYQSSVQPSHASVRVERS